MRKHLRNILIGLSLLVALPSMRALAAGRDGFRLDDSGTVTVLSQHAAKEEISSLGFSLLVESENADKVTFQFEESSAEILEFRYDQDTGKLNIYVAGTERLFAEGTDALTVGRVIVRDENGGEASARVSVVEDSLQYVYGSERKTMQELDLPEAVQLGSSGNNPPDVSPTSVPSPVQTPEPTARPDDPAATPDPVPVQTPEPETRPDDSEETFTPGQTPGSEAGSGAPAVPTTPAPSPVGTPRPTARPGAPAVPTRSPGAGNSFQASAGTPKPSPGSSPEGTAVPADGESMPDVTAAPADGESTPGVTPLPGGGNGDQAVDEGMESQGVDIVLVVAIAAIVLFVIVVAAAFVVLGKLPKKPKE